MIRSILSGARYVADAWARGHDAELLRKERDDLRLLVSTLRDSAHRAAANCNAAEAALKTERAENERLASTIAAIGRARETTSRLDEAARSLRELRDECECRPNYVGLTMLDGTKFYSRVGAHSLLGIEGRPEGGSRIVHSGRVRANGDWHIDVRESPDEVAKILEVRL